MSYAVNLQVTRGKRETSKMGEEKEERERLYDVEEKLKKTKPRRRFDNKRS
jgi:hypothetical protein